ncbi:MAG TPA: SAM-dependent methyltransferase [Planctomycetaceae bacterium]|nr:SAM-dependent methyltransferase [Planctomycetaceae bacterium]
MPLELPPPLARALRDRTIRKITLSERRPAAPPGLARVQIRPLALKDRPVWQFTLQIEQQAIHENLDLPQATRRLAQLLAEAFRQVHWSTADSECSARPPRQPGGSWQVHETPRQKPAGTPPPDAGHDRTKQYLIPQGVPCPFLQEMGVMNPQGQVLRPMMAKYRQINRFLELVRDALVELPRDRELRVIDFGCGKSYLTFALHHLLTTIEHRPARITGLDLKRDVIENCQEVARRLGCSGLEFHQGRIDGFEANEPVDLVVSLHACDTATDDALVQALRWQARVILAVPCCQHELAPQLAHASLEPLLRHGIARERLGALVTDALRALVLERQGYSTQMVEFIDLEHTPKNLLLRGVRRTHQPLSLTATRHQELLAYRSLFHLAETHLERRLIEQGLAEPRDPVTAAPAASTAADSTGQPN